MTVKLLLRSSDFGEPFGSEPFDTLRAVSNVEPLRAELLSRVVNGRRSSDIGRR
jgi:hypothetical protein